MSHPFKKGFTLLELLVVIAIVGILAAILLSYLNVSRNRGNEAGVKQNLTNARSQAALYYANSGNSYTGLCGDAKILSMVRRATTISALTPQVAAYANTDIGDWDEEACHASGNQYAIWVPLKESISSAATAAWCIDSTDNGSRRVSGAGLTLGSGIYVCP